MWTTTMTMSGASEKWKVWSKTLPLMFRFCSSLTFHIAELPCNPFEVVVLVMFEGWQNTMTEIHFHFTHSHSPPNNVQIIPIFNFHCVWIRIVNACMNVKTENWYREENSQTLNGIRSRMLAISARNLRNLLSLLQHRRCSLLCLWDLQQVDEIFPDLRHYTVKFKSIHEIFWIVFDACKGREGWDDEWVWKVEMFGEFHEW